MVKSGLGTYKAGQRVPMPTCRFESNRPAQDGQLDFGRLPGASHTICRLKQMHRFSIATPRSEEAASATDAFSILPSSGTGLQACSAHFVPWNKQVSDERKPK
jgi:hypothetical protein